MKPIFFGIIILLSLNLQAQNYSHYTTTFIGGFAADNDNLPYWFYHNQKGRLDFDTNILGIASHDSSLKFDSNTSLQLGAGALYQDGQSGDFQIDQLYLRFKNSWLKATVGAWHEEEELDGLSSTNKNILWSSNTRAIPGILLEANNPIKIFNGFALSWGIGHYELDDDRFANGARIHHKRLGAFIDFNKKSQLKLEIQHYAQWAGASNALGESPSGFSDFIDVFLARRAGDETAFEGEQINALGNHLGSYNFEYTYNFDQSDLKLYHQHLFEDGSGTAFKNFPDGLWGIYWNRENTWIKSLLYEFVYTLNQSGSRGRSARDNYFSNTVYRSGWRYKSRVIGIPFITPNTIENGSGNNRIRAHHFGTTATIKNIEALLKVSYVEGLGTYAGPIVPKIKSLYTYGTLNYATKSYGTFSLSAGFDALSSSNDKYGLGLSYFYNIK